MPAVVRAFVAVTCGEQLNTAVTTALDDWRQGPGGGLPVRWVRPENRHLTLQFLGDWPETRLETLQAALSAAPTPEPFRLNPGALDGFPNLKSPRVLFLQMTDPGQGALLAKMVRESTDRCWPDGPQDTRAFRAHLTLGRVKSRLSRQDCKLLQDLDFSDLPEVSVEGFSLMGSELKQDGPRYTELDFFPLRK